MKSTTVERQGKDEEWSHQACFFGNMYPAGSNIYYFNVYKAQQICRGSQSSYESCGRDRYFEHVCSHRSPRRSKLPWILLILMFPIMGLGLYLLVGLNGGTEKMRRRYQKIDEQLLPLLPANRKIQEKLTAENSKSRKYFFLYPQKCRVSGVSEYRCDLF